MPEYAATLTDFLNTKQNGANAPQQASGDINATMTGTDRAGPEGATWCSARRRTAADENAFAVTKALATKYNLTTLSDFAARCSGIKSVLGGPPECSTAAVLRARPRVEVRHHIRCSCSRPTPAVRSPRPR